MSILSDEKIKELWDSHEKQWPEIGKVLINPVVFARAIEAAVLEAQSKQEPVAHVADRDACMVWWNDKFTHISQAPKNNTPLYAAPVVQPGMVKDAERYRWLRDESQVSDWDKLNEAPHPNWDDIIDAMIAAAEGKE